MNYPDVPTTETQTIAVDGLVEGESYRFKVRARNVYGYGEFSDFVEIIASMHPGVP